MHTSNHGGKGPGSRGLSLLSLDGGDSMLTDVKPSAAFRRWVDAHLARADSGSRLPPVNRLCAQFNLSETTVRRILRSFQNEGKLLLLPGRGTFVAGGRREIDVPDETPTSSAATIEKYITDSISCGDIRIGQQLPSVKYMSIQFKVARQTVTKAYRNLKARGIATRIGKSYWAGRGSLTTRQAATRKGFIFTWNSEDFSSMFHDPNIFLQPWINEVMRAMEMELISHGWDLRFETTAQLGTWIDHWKRESELPSGLFLHLVNERKLKALLPQLKRLQSAVRLNRSRIVLDWEGGNPRCIPGSYFAFARGNILSLRARTLAHFIAGAGYRNVCFHYDENELDISYLRLALRIRHELRTRDSSILCRIIVVLRGGQRTRDMLFEDFLKSIGRELSQKLAFTGYRSAIQLKEEMVCTTTPEKYYCNKNLRTINVFITDEAALRAIRWAAETGKSLPADFGIVSLENNPDYLHHRISCCIPDTSGIGYLMAHALIGDISFRKTGLGFIRARALMQRRGTC